MKVRARWFFIAVAVLVAASVVAWLVLRRPYRDAQALLELLPAGADAYVVLDLDVLQSNPALKKLISEPPPGALSPSYRQLLNDTGFRYQTDLKQLAAAKIGPDWIGAAIVNLDHPRVMAFLESQNGAKSEVMGRPSFSFGMERRFHLVFVDDRLMAFAIGDPKPLRDVILRHTSWFGSSAREHLHQAGLTEPLPAGSGLWLVGWMDRLVEANPASGIGALQFGEDWWAGRITIIACFGECPLQLDFHL
jgi:hypothetical protein